LYVRVFGPKYMTASIGRGVCYDMQVQTVPTSMASHHALALS
jgi:hypothetical protein